MIKRRTFLSTTVICGSLGLLPKNTDKTTITIYYDKAHGIGDVDLEKIGSVQAVKLIKEKINDKWEDGGWISKIRINKDSINDIFIRGLVSRNSQRWPIQMIIKENNQPTLIKNIWIERLGSSEDAKNQIIINDVNFLAECIE